jgi:ribosomal-protein-alanine N-acetyltransferase
VPGLQRLRAGHAPALLAFERANRTYFAAKVSDRGDEFFARFTERLDELLAEQDAGTGPYHVLVDVDGAVLGRFNLFDVGNGTANLGYRVAERAAGRGLATAAVRDLCVLALSQYGLHTLRAATTHANVASQRVLAKVGFVPVGPVTLSSGAGTQYQLDLTAD